MREYLPGGLSYKIEKGCRSYQLLPEILYLNFLFFRVQRYSNQLVQRTVFEGGSAQHISGLSIYVELGLCSVDIWGEESPKKYRYFATISYQFYLQTTVTLIYSCRFEEQFFNTFVYHTYELFCTNVTQSNLI